MLRNKEFRQFAVCFAAIAVAAILAGFAIGEAAGALAAVSSFAFAVAFYAFTRARYKRIARLSDQIDLVLHHAERLDIGECEEGELSILQSEIVKMTLRIREQNDALTREKERLADSLADIAHQLRTPLTSVNLTLSLLEASTDEEERRAFARETGELLGRMDWLLTALLKLSRLDAGIVVFQSETVFVSDLVRAALRPLLIPLELRGIDVRADVPEGAALQGDPDWLAQALQNILKNCMENAGEGGRIEIECVDNPLYTRITVRDSGPGFDAAQIPRLFDRFYRGKSTDASGYGIGLALCRGIITRQGGTVAAKNHPQGGALFDIRFPK